MARSKKAESTRSLSQRGYRKLHTVYGATASTARAKAQDLARGERQYGKKYATVVSVGTTEGLGPENRYECQVWVKSKRAKARTTDPYSEVERMLSRG